MSRGAWMPIRTFSPMIDKTDTSMSSPIMIDWLDLRVSTSIAPPPWRLRGSGEVSAHSAYLQWGLHPRPLTPLALAYRPLMSRRSLRPQLNQIRGWVRQGRTDAWIAHQLDVTVQQIQAFKREQDLEADGADAGANSFEEVDLRAEDDAASAAELEEE